MAAPDPWLAVHTRLGDDVRIHRLVYDGVSFEIYDTMGPATRALVVPHALAATWLGPGLLSGTQVHFFDFGPERLAAVFSDGRLLSHVEHCPQPVSASEAIAFAAALRRTRQRVGRRSLTQAVYSERYSVLLPVAADEAQAADDVLLGAYLTGGVQVSCRALRRIAALQPYLSIRELEHVIREAGLPPATETQESYRARSDLATSKPEFRLHGRRELEQFFLEHVIDIAQNPERYAPLGIDFPPAIVLHGPPGCGKTYAVERLVEFLDWPAHSIDSGSIGSKYIHETSRKITEVFERARQQSPAVVVIDEMEAFLAERERGGDHRLEEVGEFLRRIAEALANRVLVIGMTNRLDLIDPAVLRRGRFDHVISVGMPTADETLAVLESALANRSEGSLNLPLIAQRLMGRPLSDTSFLCREAGRLAGRAGKQRIDSEAMETALANVLSRASDPLLSERRIGFR